MTNQIMKHEERIDHEVEDFTMSKLGFIHINHLNNQRHVYASTFVKSAVPSMVAKATVRLEEWMGTHPLKEFIELFRTKKHQQFYAKQWSDDACECDDNYECSFCEWERSVDCDSMHDDDIAEFYDFCVQLNGTMMFGFPDKYLPVMIEYINRNRDLLFDDETDEKKYFGRFTTADPSTSKWFDLEKARELFPKQKEEGEEE